MARSPVSDEKIKIEEAQINSAVAELFGKWADLEDRHAVILETIIGDPNVAFRIYFAPSNTETRLRIVDAAVVGMITGRSRINPRGTRERILECWRRINASVQRLKNTRNTVAHGHLGTISTPRKDHTRWLSPKYDIARWGATGQIDGLSVNDIQNCATAIERVIKQMWVFDDVLRGLKGLHKSPLPQILDELESSFSTAPPRSVDPADTTPEVPPEPSQA